MVLVSLKLVCSSTVQHPRPRAQVTADLATLRWLAWAVAVAFPEFGYEWLLPEFEASIEAELDFTREARNAHRTAALFADVPWLHVPRVIAPESSGRVLTMEYVAGAKIDDEDAVRRLGLAPAAVAGLLGTAFCRMIFHDGFVHCDPHAGNLLVRRMPAAGGGGGSGGDGGGGGGGGDSGGGGGGMQLVLLDHGMYRELGESFRRSYCALWVRLLSREPQAQPKP